MQKKIIFGILMTVTLLGSAYAKEPKAREFEVFGQKYSLENGKLNDTQAQQINHLLKKKQAELDLRSEDLFKIWDDLGIFYFGGKYYSQIMLNALVAYVNYSFTELLHKNTSQKYRPAFMNGFGYVYDSYTIEQLYGRHSSNYSRTDVIYYVYNCVPEFQKERGCGYQARVDTVSNNFSSRWPGWENNGTPHIQDEAIRRNINRTGEIKKHFFTTVKLCKINLERSIKAFEEKVPVDSVIFTSGKYDLLLTRIVNIYIKVDKAYGKEVAEPLFKALSEMLYPFLKTDAGRKNFIQAIKEMAIPFKIPVVKDKSLIAL